MTIRELSRHIYFYSQTCKKDKSSNSEWDENDDLQVINYISHLIELHFEPENHIGSKGFKTINVDKRSEFGC
jgi:hypothetical protein